MQHSAFCFCYLPFSRCISCLSKMRIQRDDKLETQIQVITCD